MQEEFNPNRKATFTFLFLIAISVFFMTARLEGYVQGIKNLFYYILFPTQASSEKIFKEAQRVSFNIKDIINAHQENLELHKIIEKYIQLENEWQTEKSENERLRSILKIEAPKRNKIIAARVVSREPGSWFQWVVIDKGLADGLPVDAPVLIIVNSRLCVVGRIGEVFSNSSKVILLTNALFAMPAMISSTKEDGLLEGQNGPLMRVNYLVSKKLYSAGEEVITSPLSSVMPEGLIIGKIKTMLPNDDETFSSAVLEPEVDLGNLREVIVLIPESGKPKNKN